MTITGVGRLGIGLCLFISGVSTAEPGTVDIADCHSDSLVSERTLGEIQGQLTCVAERVEDVSLYWSIGIYTVGDRPLYTGRFATSDNFGGNGPDSVDGVLAEADVWAMLVSKVRHQSGTHAQLLVVSDATQQKFSMLQAPDDVGSTGFTPVTPFTTNAGIIGRCTGCTPSLFESPQTITLDNVVATKTFDGFKGRVTLDGRLTQVPLGDLTLDLVKRANERATDGHAEHTAGLSATGDAYVRRVSGRAEIPIDSSLAGGLLAMEPGRLVCRDRADFTAEWWVDATDLGRHGVRNVALGPITRQCCEPYVGNSTPVQCGPSTPVTGP